MMMVTEGRFTKRRLKSALNVRQANDSRTLGAIDAHTENSAADFVEKQRNLRGPLFWNRQMGYTSRKN
jgi:hypothetical protein